MTKTDFKIVSNQDKKSTSENLLTTKEASAYLKIAPRTVYRYIKKHDLPAFKLGREWRFVRSELDKWIMRKIRENNAK